MASETGRGAQVRLDDTARQLARGGAGLRLIDSIVAKAALEAAGTAPSGNTPDGSLGNGTAADDEVLLPGGLGASASFTATGSGAVARTVTSKLGEAGVSLKDFGAVGDGVTSDQAALAAFFTYLQTNGGVGVIPAGTYRQTAAINVWDGTQAFKVVGAGRDLVTIKRAAAIGTPFDIRRTNDLLFEGVTFDGGYDAFPTSANHGLSVLDCSRIRFVRCRVKNYLNTSILNYCTVQNTYGDSAYDDLEIDGMGVANNGAYFEGLDRCVMRGVKVRNCPGNPGYGLQLKNNCRWTSIDDCYVDTCSAGVAFGQSTGAVSGGTYYSRVNGVTVRNCGTGFVSGYGRSDLIAGLSVDMGGLTGRAIDLQNSVGMGLTGAVVANLAAGQIAVRVQTSTDCFVSVEVADMGDATSYFASFSSSSARNTVRFGRVVGQASDTPLATSRLVDNSGGVGNAVEFGDSVWTVASNVIRNIVGTGSPEGVVTARIGSQYRRYDGGASTTLYVKESGTSSSGWRAV